MNIEEKAKEILRSKLTDIDLECYLKGSPLTYNACLEAVKEAINYTHSCKSDSEQLCEHKSLQSAMCEVDYCPDCNTYIPS